MTVELNTATAILLSPDFNPSAFSQVWMIQHLDMTPEDFAGQAVIQTPVAFAAPTRDRHLLVLPNQLQVTPVLAAGHDARAVGTTLHAVLDQFPGLNYTAIGLNFLWTVIVPGEHISDLSRRLFYNPAHPLFREFNQPNAGFGAYLSRDFMGFRLKLDIKPNPRDNVLSPEHDFVYFTFNFHGQVPPEDPLGAIHRFADQWHAARAESDRLMGVMRQEFGL